MSPIHLRPATEADAAALVEIYRPSVEGSATSFETACPTVEVFATRIARYGGGWAWLVATDGERPVGYAYAAPHRERPAYRYSVETSVYVDRNHRRRGIARTLYTALLAELAQKGFCNALAAVTLPNPASIALHQSLGFEPIGTYRAIGYKLGAWHDVAWFGLRLREEPGRP